MLQRMVRHAGAPPFGSPSLPLCKQHLLPISTIDHHHHTASVGFTTTTALAVHRSCVPVVALVTTAFRRAAAGCSLGLVNDDQATATHLGKATLVTG